MQGVLEMMICAHVSYAAKLLDINALIHHVFPRFQNISYKGKMNGYAHSGTSPIHRKSNVSYPKRAILTLTRSSKAHSNISALNKDRNGQLTLLASLPPKWASIKRLTEKINTI